MPIIFSTSSLALPATLARFTGLDILKKAAIALTPGGKLRGFLVYFATDIYFRENWNATEHLLLND
jgi:preprotein translocase subunit SecY